MAVRILVVIPEPKLGAFVELGAFAALADEELSFVTPPLKHPRSLDLVARQPGFLGAMDVPREVVLTYRRLENAFIAARRKRAVGLAVSLEGLTPDERRRAKLEGLPGVHAAIQRHALKSVAPNDALDTLIRRKRPDLLIVIWSYWGNPLAYDAIRVARGLGIPSLMLNANWDGISCTGGFPIPPDYLGVWGEQTIEHARTVHGYQKQRVFKLGSPGFQPYFDKDLAHPPSPFPFRYVLFIGTHARWDERLPLARLNALISKKKLDHKIVYRPYPNRYERHRPDFVDEDELEHVAIDPDVRESYLAHFNKVASSQPIAPYPTADYFPALLGNAEFVVCPLSTMMVESALLNRRVIVPAYDDGFHTELKLSDLARFEIFDGMDRIRGYRIARSPDELDAHFAELLALEPPEEGEIRDDPVIRWWLHWDERTYAERLAEVVHKVAGTAANRPEPAAILA
jgi:hypothetical protein